MFGLDKIVGFVRAVVGALGPAGKAAVKAGVEERLGTELDLSDPVGMAEAQLVKAIEGSSMSAGDKSALLAAAAAFVAVVRAQIPAPQDDKVGG